MPSSAEDRVKKLAKQKSNTKCPNCGTEKKFGFSTVCIKFFTFVCNECKTSHQAISHRCKSLTMSSWTNEEVAALERNGNVMARRTWLKNAPPEGQGGRPCPGMDINVYKRFIVEAYEHKRYYGELDPNDGMGDPGHGFSAAPATGRQGGGVPSAAAAARVRKPARQKAVVPAPVAPSAPPAPAPVADLLSFGSAAPAVTSAPVSGNADLFSADFSSFPASPAPAPVAATSKPASTMNGFDAFASAPAVQAPVSASVGQVVDPFAFGAFGGGGGSGNSTTNNTNTKKAGKAVTISTAADPFDFGSFGSSLPGGGSTSSTNNNKGKKSSSGGSKKPIMGGPSATGSSNADAISMMGGGPPGQSNKNNNTGGMMMPPNNNNKNNIDPMMMMNMNNNMMAANMQMMAMMQQQQQQMMNGGGMGMAMSNPQMGMNNGMMMMGNTAAPNMTMGSMNNNNNQNMMGMMNSNPGMMMMMNPDQQRAFQQMMMNQNNKR